MGERLFLLLTLSYILGWTLQGTAIPLGKSEQDGERWATPSNMPTATYPPQHTRSNIAESSKQHASVEASDLERRKKWKAGTTGSSQKRQARIGGRLEDLPVKPRGRERGERKTL